MTISIKNEQKILIELEDKKDIEQIVSYEDISENELHVLQGSNILRLLKTIEGTVSFALFAKADKRFGVPDFCMGYSVNLNIIRVKKQKTPLTAKNYGITRDLNDSHPFRDNALYVSYYINITSPSRRIWDQMDKSATLAPWAIPDEHYQEKR